LNKKGCEKRDNESEEDESYIRNEFSNTRWMIKSTPFKTYPKVS
jgi:hypothetical protein